MPKKLKLENGGAYAYGTYNNFREGMLCVIAYVVDENGRAHDPHNRHKNPIVIAEERGGEWLPALIEADDLAGTWEEYLEHKQEHDLLCAQIRSRKNIIKGLAARLGPKVNFKADPYHNAISFFFDEFIEFLDTLEKK